MTNSLPESHSIGEAYTPIRLVVFLTALLYSPALFIGFLNDDIANVQAALSNVREGYEHLFSSAGLMGQYFRPLVNASFVFDHAVWGWEPAGFRLSNIMFHVVNVALVYTLGLRLLSSQKAAVSGAALFAAQPIHELSILWLPGRTDLICSMFYLLSIILFLRFLENRKRSNLALSLFAFGLALLSKEMAFSLPLLIPALAYWIGRLKQQRQPWRLIAGLAAPYAAVSILFIAARAVFLDNYLFSDAQGLHSNVSLVHILKNLVFYVGALALPFGHYEIEQLISLVPQLVFPSAIMGTFVILVLLFRFRDARIPTAFFFLWIAITVLPVSRLFMRWYLYIPSVGFCIAVAWVLDHSQTVRQALRWSMTAVLLILYGSVSLARNLDWVSVSSSAGALLTDVVNKIPAGADSVEFITIPSRIKTTHVFHLGFPATLRHALGDKDMSVSIWSSVVLRSLTRSVSVTPLENGAFRARANSGGWFFIDTGDLIMKRIVPGEGMMFSLRGLDVSIIEVDDHHKPIELVFRPVRPLAKTILYFDGNAFRVVR